MIKQPLFNSLGDGILHLDAEYLSPGIASVYVLIENEECAIIETGTFHTVPSILAVLKANGLTEDNVRYVIPTHVHLDHAGGVGQLMKICPNAELVVHPKGARHMISPEKLSAGVKAVYGDTAFEEMYGELIPVDADRVLEAPDNFEVRLGERVLRFYDTPGHARHHFCIHDLKSNTIFSGDTFGIAYPQLETTSERFIFATTTPVQFDPAALRASIARLLSVKPAAFNLTHFGRIVATESVVTQLHNSIDKFVAIAEQAESITEDRVAHIDQQIRSYLLDCYQALGGTQSDEKLLEVITMDSKLNAQGLDVWLSLKAQK